ncbi:MAG: S-adenosylmethionine:tRNA ribosyltransferase-isomerase, partial [Bacteroidota bacterium]
MKLSEFKFDLPNNLIALEPAENRDESRLMVV